MIITHHKCDLCKRDVNFPYGGYRLVYSGDGAISFEFLDTTNPRAKETIICKGCVRGLRYAISHVPSHPEGDDE